MAENSKIEWTDHTFNPWEGCQKVGPGCDHCYAEKRNARFGGGSAINWGAGAPRRRTSATNWRKPRQWQADAARFLAEHGRRQRVFCASLADVFDNAVDPDWRSDLFELIDQTPDLDWLLLTKRIGNAATMLRADWERDAFPPNVWLGATIVNQAEADRDIPKLLAAPARVRFLSIEPLLGPVDLAEVSNTGTALDPECWGDCACDSLYGRDPGCRRNEGDGQLQRKIDWVIVGGESGPGARPMHPDWARGLRDQCTAAGVAFLFKQWGEWEVALDRERDDADWRADYTNDFGDRGKTKWLNLAGGCGFHGERFHVMRRVGKKEAGRALDGVTHDGVPA
ncbi:phage Gp37/Gp68 family protein [Sphingomonas montanisoli]|uniref:Phage Gp37/Gp68 family protein n=1 Tax=Sphingomonas montanisoli TaxID=2606412 RepID=A0A5D9C1H6_9SPHN|nr:phage Gp37/Gp68 family protein [Sphingomonas montanisoli]TZG24900.1 phage Gp37/Gp68 family protein [Sphingomonas montanisoli]